MNDQIKFGCFNTRTGNFQKDYIDGNEMKFKPLTFWQRFKLRFWDSPLKEKVYIGTITLTKSNWLTGSECELQVAMYKTHNPYTQEIYKVWAAYQGKGIYFNVDAYKQGKLIRK